MGKRPSVADQDQLIDIADTDRPDISTPDAMHGEINPRPARPPAAHRLAALLARQRPLPSTQVHKR
jgi:hypothetical protein